MVSLTPILSPLTLYPRTDEGLKCGAILGDVFKDPTTRKSYRQEDCAFHRAHGVSAFDYYGAVRVRFSHVYPLHSPSNNAARANRDFRGTNSSPVLGIRF